MGFIKNVYDRTTILKYQKKDKIKQILKKLIEISSTPLRSVETHFSIDSSGFSTSVNQPRWSEFKHLKGERRNKWVKCHIVCGVKTNIISAVKLTSEFNADSPQMKELLNKTNKNFEIKEFSGDKAYSSVENLEAINEIGAEPLIPFRKNVSLKSTHKRCYVWKKSLNYFLFNQEEFKQHYHKRSNVETSFHMIKSKYGQKVKSRCWNSQVNEVLSKILCHNISVLITELFELGIDINLIMN